MLPQHEIWWRSQVLRLRGRLKHVRIVSTCVPNDALLVCHRTSCRLCRHIYIGTYTSDRCMCSSRSRCLSLGNEIKEYLSKVENRDRTSYGTHSLTHSAVRTTAHIRKRRHAALLATIARVIMPLNDPTCIIYGFLPTLLLYGYGGI